MPHFSKIPADTVLEILPYLSFRDGLALSMVLHICTIFASSDAPKVSSFINRIASTRSYWHTLITVNRLTEGPLSVSPDDDLTSYDATQLKNIILHKLRLEANWARADSQCVRLARPVTSFCCRPRVAGNNDNDSTLLFHVSATEFVVTMGAGMFTCWSVASGQPVAQVSTNFHRTAFFAPPALHHEPGRCTAIVHCIDSSHKVHTVILRLDYGLSPVCLTVNSYQVLPSQVRRYDLAVAGHTDWVSNGDIVAHIIWNDKLCIHAENIHDGRTSHIRTDIPSCPFVGGNDDIEDTDVKLIFWKGDLFIWQAEFYITYQVFIHRCPANLLPSSNNPVCPPVSDVECYDPSLSYMIVDADWAGLANTVYPPARTLNVMALEQLHFCAVSGRLRGVFYAEFGRHDASFQMGGFVLMSWDFSKFNSNSLAYNAKPLSIVCDTSLAFRHDPRETPQAFSSFGSLLFARAPPPLSKPQLYVRRAMPDGSSTDFLQLEKPENLEVKDAQITLDDGLGMVLVMNLWTAEISVLQYA